MQAPEANDQQEIGRLLGAAIARHEAGQLAEAEALYAEVLRHDARQPDALNLKAILSAQTGRTDEALELIRAAIVEQPQNHHFRFNHGHILELSGSPRAVAAYREALTIDPHHLPALVNLGHLLLAPGGQGGGDGASRSGRDRLAEAIDCFNRAITVDPGVVQAHEGLGMALQRRHDRDGALAAFERALKLDPRSTEAMANAGALLIELGRAAESERHLRGALAQAPERPDLWVNLAVALHDKGDPGAALEAARRARSLAPDSARATAMLALFLADAGDAAGAAEILDPGRRLRTRRLTTVPGYPDLAAFNRALTDHVLGHPGLKPGPGGAGRGDLSRDDDPAVQTLAATIEAEVEACFAAADAADPYGARRPARWRLEMTAAVLDPAAGEAPRIDPEARLSGCYTVRPPAPGTDGAEAGAEAGAEPGAMVFGAVPERFGALELPRRAVPPRAGQLLLFPSWLWHGVRPAGEGPESLEIRFQVVPEAE